jgi:hypothetical protein
MIAFQVAINGRPVCTAGIGASGVLTAIVNWVGTFGEGDFRLSIGGLSSSTNEHLTYPAPAIGVGDEITVRVVEADASKVNLPIEHRPRKSRPNNPGNGTIPDDNQ